MQASVRRHVTRRYRYDTLGTIPHRSCLPGYRTFLSVIVFIILRRKPEFMIHVQHFVCKLEKMNRNLENNVDPDPPHIIV